MHRMRWTLILRDRKGFWMAWLGLLIINCRATFFQTSRHWWTRWLGWRVRERKWANRNANFSRMDSPTVTLALISVLSRVWLSTVLVVIVGGTHRTCSCSVRFSHSASTHRHPELLLLSRVPPTMALERLSETLLLFSLVDASSVESWGTMLTTVPREWCRLLRETVVTGLGSHLHRLALHRLLAREASRITCVAGLIMYQWSKLRMTPAWYWVRFLSTLYLLQYYLIQEHHIHS
jgi:hypothetical protein